MELSALYINMDAKLKDAIEKLRVKKGWTQREAYERGAKLLIEFGTEEPCRLIVDPSSKEPKVYSLPLDVGNYIRKIEDENHDLLQAVAEIKKDIAVLRKVAKK